MEIIENIIPTIATYPAGIVLKKRMLQTIASSILIDPSNKQELQCILNEANLSAKDVVEAYVKYDFDLYAYGNEIYDSLAMRMVLYMHDLLTESWHAQGQKVLTQFIKVANPQNFIDMGFGAPAPYLKKILKDGLIKVTLCDVFDSAFTFAKILLSHWNLNWESYITFKKIDMNDDDFVGPYDLYIFQDSIEHVEEPEAYLRKYVVSSSSDAHFIFSLPIGPLVPVYYITWHSAQSAISWLKNCGLEIVNSEEIPINPDVDLFAEQLNFDYKTLMVLCKKKSMDC